MSNNNIENKDFDSNETRSDSPENAEQVPPETNEDSESFEAFDETRIRQFKQIQNLIAVAFIAGPISMLIGGLLLSTIALICAVMAFVKIRRLAKTGLASESQIISSLKTQSLIALLLCVVTTGANLVWFVIMAANIMGATNLNDLESLDKLLQDNNLFGQQGGNSSNPQKSIWD